MKWREAKAITQLKNQINALAPNRDKTSDGTIGDADHVTRASDHNPWVKDSEGIGVVTAVDIDEDLRINKTMQEIVDSICSSRDNRVKYIIYEKKITVKGSDLQEWKNYTGKNPHDHHVHISLMADQNLYDNMKPWELEKKIQAYHNLRDHEYMVVKGDSLWGISRKFSTSVDKLMSLNGLKSDFIQAGTVLKVR